MIFVEEEPACPTRQIENVMLRSFAATVQAPSTECDGCRYCAQTHVRRVHQELAFRIYRKMFVLQTLGHPCRVLGFDLFAGRG